ncbi:MAG: anti-sigma regulatory factor [Desulfarculus sp.]|jgi:anti-sigma regulatory factor (Ser/Thr protein kinase)|nr:MAG: anti-sigma regulatory factor [Desulfarculus sp.]
MTSPNHGPQDLLQLVQTFIIKGDDFAAAGSVSLAIKKLLKEVGFPPEALRRVAITAFEAEMNVVMYGGGGEVSLFLAPGTARLVIKDHGPGIPDLDLAMQEGWSTATAAMREMGFGAGMGLPNIRKNSSRFHVDTALGQGTTLTADIDI